MKKTVVLMMVMAVAAAGCQKDSREREAAVTMPVAEGVQKAGAKVQRQGQAAKPKEAASFKPFYIYETKGFRGNHYVPSGYMPNSNCMKMIEDWRENCHTGATCIKVVYDVECSRKDEKWAGVYWLNPANNWGTRKGGFNLTGAQRLTFWARGEKGGEQVQEFTVGGITGDYPDSDTAVIGPVILGTAWKKYTVDLRGKDLSYISGGFAWTTSEDVNPEDCTFYLDEIRFE